LNNFDSLETKQDSNYKNAWEKRSILKDRYNHRISEDKKINKDLSTSISNKLDVLSTLKTLRD